MTDTSDATARTPLELNQLVRADPRMVSAVVARLRFDESEYGRIVAASPLTNPAFAEYVRASAAHEEAFDLWEAYHLNISATRRLILRELQERSE